MLSVSEQPVRGANRAEWDADANEDGGAPWRSDRGGRKGGKDGSRRQLPHQASLIHLNRQSWYWSPENCELISRSSSSGELMPLWSLSYVFQCVSVNLRRRFKSRKEPTPRGPRSRLFVKENRKTRSDLKPSLFPPNKPKSPGRTSAVLTFLLTLSLLALPWKQRTQQHGIKRLRTFVSR